MILAGIDYSMSCPAICIHDTNLPLEFYNMHFYAMSSGAKKYLGDWGNIHIVPHLPWSSPEERYRNIAYWACEILKRHGVEEICLEGYSMGSTGGLVFNIAENTSVLKQMLHDLRIPYRSPSPSSVKKSFSGKGNAKKDAMCEAFIAKFGVKIHEILGSKFADTPENDLVDSCANMLTHPHFGGVV